MADSENTLVPTPHRRQDRDKGPDFAKLLRVIVWPLTFLIIALFALYLSRSHIAVKNLQLSTDKGFEMSFYLLAAAQSSAPDGTSPSTPPNITDIRQQAQKASTISLQGATVLWVDDNPDNNEYERKALEPLGVQFVMAESTHEALLLLSKQHFSLIISDFMRRDDPQGGYTLLRDVKGLPDSVPLIIYSASSNPGFEHDAKTLGAVGETNNPQTLFNMVIDTIKKAT